MPEVRLKGARGDYGLGRSVTMSLRMTEAEASTIRGRAEGEGLATSELLRRMALIPSWRPLGQDAVEQLRGLRNQLRLAGNNLNQLTRMAHLAGLGERQAAGLGADLSLAVQEVRRLGQAIGAAVDGVSSHAAAAEGVWPGRGQRQATGR